jgi:hypothetical protein
MLGIAIEKVCDIITRARAFDSQIPLGEEDEEPGEFEADDEIDEDQVLAQAERYKDDPTYLELVDFMDSLNEEEQINLVALAWLGRGDYTVDDWASALEAAREAHNDRTGEYLLGIPLIGDYLEEGLSAFGESCED